MKAHGSVPPAPCGQLGNWSSVPRSGGVDGGARLTVLPVSLWIVLVGPIVRAASLPASRPSFVVAVGVPAALIIMGLPSRAWWARLLVAIAAGAVAYPVQGSMIASWIVAGLVLAPWIAQRRPPIPGLPRPTSDATLPAVVLCGLAAWAGSKPEATWQPAVPLGLAFLLPVLGRLGGGVLHRVTRRVGEVAGAATSAVGLGALSVPVVLVPWAGQQVLRTDPLDASPGWMPRERRPLQPRQLWAPESVAPRAPLRQRLRAPAALVACALVALALSARAPWSSPDRPDARLLDDGLLGPSASRGKGSWYREYREDVAWVFDEKVALRPFEIYRLLDVETRHVNVLDGQRRTFVAPDCDCQRLTVWMYGGGGVFGLEQRDEHTIASELVRVAFEDGIVLDVRNRGIPGQLHWRSALRFAWDLTTERPPDLVVFYEGAEEVESALRLSEKGLGDTRAPYEPYIEKLYDELMNVTDVVPPPPEGAEYLGWPTVSDVPKDQVGLLAARRFTRSLQLSDDTARAAGVPVRYFWQPSRYGTGPVAASGSSGAEQLTARAFVEASEHLDDPRVTDLSGALGTTRPSSFVDDVHHDEVGARVVAERIFRSVSDDLQRIGRDRSGDR